MLGKRFFFFGAASALFAASAAAGGCAGEPFEQAGGSGGTTTTTTTTTTTGGGGAGATTTTGAGGDAGAGGVACQPLGDECSACAYAACTEAYCSCYAVPDCAALVGCFETCTVGDVTCQQQCGAAHSDSISQAFLLGDCTATACGTSVCPGVEVLDPCRACLFESCGDAMNACLANADCLAILTCVQATCAPSDQNCLYTCAGQHPAGQTLALPVAACLSSTCSAACATTTQ